MTFARSFVPLAACTFMAAASCGGDGPGSASSTSVPRQARPFDPSLRESTQAACIRGSGPDMTYCNGPIESVAQIVPILWGSNVDATIQGDIIPALSSFFSTDFEGDSALSWLGGDYNPNLLNFMSAGGASVITITPSNSSTSISTSDITAELAHQFSLSPSPISQPPEAGWGGPIYVIVFPPGITVTGPGTSCKDFTGLHSTGSYHNMSYAYVAIPQCISGNLPKWEWNLSHEIAEAMTDPDLSTGWCGSDCAHEIADVCGSSTGTITPVTSNGGSTHTVQALWSNSISDSKPTGSEAPNSVYTFGSVGTVSNPTTPGVTACFAEKTTETRIETGQSTFASNQTFLADHFNGGASEYDVAKVYSDANGKIGIEVHEAAFGTTALRAVDWTGTAGSQGAFAADMAFMSGNFDGDIAADIADAWNNSGCIALDVHRSEVAVSQFQLFSQAGKGDCFSHGIWSDRWYWVAGDFNGDGLTDIATIWSLGGATNNQEVIDLHLATGNLGFGTGFTDVPSAASNQGPVASDGYPLTGEHWFAGDVNGDGKTDLIKVYNQGGRTLINMSINNGQCAASSTSCSTTNAFSLAAAFGGLLNPTAKFYPNGQWMSGDFDANGTIDVAQVFPDPVTSNIDIDVELSTAGSTVYPGIVTFYPQRWTMRQGVWSASQKWFVGDFNGDERLDFAKAYQDNILGSGKLAIDAHVRM